MTAGTPSTRQSVSTVRVRYAETDQMGVAYHANYFVWFEVGRTDWLRTFGVTYRDLEAEGFLLPVIEAHCEYRASARYDDDLRITSTARLVSPFGESTLPVRVEEGWPEEVAYVPLGAPGAPAEVLMPPDRGPVRVQVSAA